MKVPKNDQRWPKIARDDHWARDIGDDTRIWLKLILYVNIHPDGPSS
jgi:hypothetical protein